MHVKMNFSKKTKNQLADPEIGFHVCVRQVPEGKKMINSGDRTRATRRESSVALPLSRFHSFTTMILIDRLCVTL